jgi:hypothetical protein
MVLAFGVCRESSLFVVSQSQRRRDSSLFVVSPVQCPRFVAFFREAGSAMLCLTALQRLVGERPLGIQKWRPDAIEVH